MAFNALLIGVVVLAIVVFRWERGREFLLPGGNPSRRATALGAVLLVLMGLLFQRILVFDDGDNAYLFVLMIGYWLFGTGLIFALATVWPEATVRGRVAVFAVGFLFALGLLNVAVLVASLAIIPSQNYNSNDVFLSHLYALLALLGAMAAVVLGNRLLRPG